MDVMRLAKQLGIGESVASRAKELLSMAVAKTPGGMGQVGAYQCIQCIILVYSIMA